MKEGKDCPNWAKWTQIPDVRLWQAVALSLNIDPETIGGEPHEERFAPHGDFKDRLDVLLTNTHNNSLLRVVSINLGNRLSSKVRLDSFAAWAKSIGWTVPRELDALGLAIGRSSPNNANIDWKYWRRMDQLPLGTAICLFVGADPGTSFGDQVRRLSSTYEFSVRQRRIFDEARKLWDLAWASHHQGKLKMNTGGAGASVAMNEWLRWASAKELDIPAELADLVPKSPHTPTVSLSANAPSEILGARERTSVLKLLLGMAIAKYKYNPSESRSAAPKAIESDLSRYGIELTDDTIRRWLDEAKNSVAYKARER